VSSDAGYECAQDERSDDDFDETEEDVAENAELGGERGRVEAEFETGEHGEEDPEGERAIAEAGCKEEEQAETAEGDERFVSGKHDEQQATREEEDESCGKQELELAGAVLWQAGASRRVC